MLTLTQLKTFLGINNTSYDAALQEYLNFIYPYLEVELGLRFSLFGTNQVLIFDKSFMFSKFVPIEAWTTITKVEVAEMQPVLTWVEWLNYNQILISASQTIPQTFIGLKAINNNTFKNKLVKITGVYGIFQPTLTDVPIMINTFVKESARAFKNYITSKGQNISSERSGNLSVSYGSVEKTLTGLDVFNPSSNLALKNILKNYKVNNHYPYL